VIFPELYEQAWLKSRGKRLRHKAFSDDFLCHDAFDFYAEKIRLSAEAERDAIKAWQDVATRRLAPSCWKPSITSSGQ
jgi:hypothetical protein